MTEHSDMLALADRLEQFARVLESARTHDNKAISVWSGDAPLVFEAAQALRLAATSTGTAVDREAVARPDEIILQWRSGYPPKPWSEEWFIAETTYGDRVVLKALPDEWTYDFKTADETYIKRDKIQRWMQFPDSQFIAPAAAPAPNAKGEPVAWSNGCDKSVPAALRYLAKYERPAGGHQDYNSEHLFQLADEIEGMASRPLYTRPAPSQPGEAAMREACAALLEATANEIMQAWLSKGPMERHLDDRSGTKAAVLRRAAAAIRALPLPSDDGEVRS